MTSGLVIRRYDSIAMSLRHRRNVLSGDLPMYFKWIMIQNNLKGHTVALFS